MKRGKLLSLFLALTLILVLSTAGFAQKTGIKVDGEIIKGYVEYMSTDEQLGRKPLTPTFRKCQEWAADNFKKWGLEPGGDDGTYFGNFEIAGRRGAFAWNLGTPKMVIKDREFYIHYGDFAFDSRSSAGFNVNSEIVFAGYGISAPDKGLDEYANIDVSGKTVLVLKGSPAGVKAITNRFSPEQPKEGENKADEWKKESEDEYKIKTAYDKGAAAVMLYNTEEEPGFRFRRGGGATFSRDFIIVSSISDNVFKWIMWQDPQESGRAFDRRISNIQIDIKNKKSRSMSTGMKTQLTSYESSTMFGKDYNNNIGRNVIGKISGTDPVLKNEYVVLGGHFDHVGVRNGGINNGADDNASGTAVVMEVGRLLAKSNFKPKRTVYFCLWDGEEMGLLGSRYWVKNPTDGVTIDKVVTNFNMDMVGLGTKIGVPGGMNFPSIWNVIIKNQDQDILDALEPSEAGPGGSDYAPFISLGIEALAIMTRGGTGHPDYHDTGDDTKYISSEILRKTGQFVIQGTINAANETKADMLIAGRQDIYDAMRMVLTNINTNIKSPAGWSMIKAQDKKELTDLIVKKINEYKTSKPDPRLARFARFRRRARTNVNLGVTPKMIGSDPAIMKMAFTSLNYGRIDVTGNDGIWFENGLTTTGASALKEMEKINVAVNLIKPSQKMVDDMLAKAEKSFIITGYSNFNDTQLKLIDDKNVLIGVDFDPSKVSDCVSKLESLKAKLGDTNNLILNLVSGTDLGKGKKELYMILLSKDWTKNEIYSIGGSGAARGSRGNFSALGR